MAAHTTQHEQAYTCILQATQSDKHTAQTLPLNPTGRASKAQICKYSGATAKQSPSESCLLIVRS